MLTPSDGAQLVDMAESDHPSRIALSQNSDAWLGNNRLLSRLVERLNGRVSNPLLSASTHIHHGLVIFLSIVVWDRDAHFKVTIC